MTCIEKLRLIVFMILISLFLYFSVAIYTSSFRSPTPIPARQITQKSLRLQELWRKSIWLPLTGRGESPRLIATNTTIAMANYDYNSSRDRLQALDVEMGRLIWDVPLPRRVRTHALIVSDEHLYAAISGQIQSYQLSDGQLLWQTSGKPTQRTGYELVWLDGNVVNYSTIQGESYSLMSVYNPITGALVRQENIPTIPLLTTTKIEYQGGCGILLAVNRSSERVKWQTELKGCPQHWPTLVGSNLLVSTYRAYGSVSGLYLIDTATGTVKWRALEDELISNFAIIEKVVYAIGRDGDIVGLDLDTGQEIGVIQFNMAQTDPSQNAYWLAANGRQLFAYYGDSRELIAFQN